MHSHAYIVQVYEKLYIRSAGNIIRMRLYADSDQATNCNWNLTLVLNGDPFYFKTVFSKKIKEDFGFSIVLLNVDDISDDADVRVVSDSTHLSFWETNKIKH